MSVCDIQTPLDFFLKSIHVKSRLLCPILDLGPPVAICFFMFFPPLASVIYGEHGELRGVFRFPAATVRLLAKVAMTL